MKLPSDTDALADLQIVTRLVSDLADAMLVREPSKVYQTWQHIQVFAERAKGSWMPAPARLPKGAKG